MLRRFFYAIAAVSLLLSIAIALLWWRARTKADRIEEITPYHNTFLISDSGELQLMQLSWSFAPNQLDGSFVAPRPGWHFHHEFDCEYNDFGWGSTHNTWHGFGLENGSSPSDYFSESPPWCDGWSVRAPDWSLMLLFLILPMVAAYRAACRKRSATTGRCRRCGYDLRASPDRCPECGTQPASSFKHSSFGH